jgi:hypothetical protein
MPPMAEEQPETGLDPQELIDDFRLRQRNLVFPDTVRNARYYYLFFWRGSSNPTWVQRVAAWLFGTVYVGQGVVLFLMAREMRDRLAGAIALLTTAIGARIFRSGFARRPTGSQPGMD